MPTRASAAVAAAAISANRNKRARVQDDSDEDYEERNKYGESWGSTMLLDILTDHPASDTPCASGTLTIELEIQDKKTLYKLHQDKLEMQRQAAVSKMQAKGRHVRVRGRR